jgi:hypothetical protein
MSNTTTAEKVRIPAEVADAIESLWSESDTYDRSNRKFINWCVKPEYQAGPRRKILQDYARENFDNFVKALYNGYEVEKPPKKITLELTPEELGTLTAALGNASTHEIVELAKEKGYIAITDPGVDMALYDRLTELALEEARA